MDIYVYIISGCRIHNDYINDIPIAIYILPTPPDVRKGWSGGAKGAPPPQVKRIGWGGQQLKAHRAGLQYAKNANKDTTTIGEYIKLMNALEYQQHLLILKSNNSLNIVTYFGYLKTRPPLGGGRATTKHTMGRHGDPKTKKSTPNLSDINSPGTFSESISYYVHTSTNRCGRTQSALHYIYIYSIIIIYVYK